MAEGKQFICIAHRGAKEHEPENTLLAIQKALELGAKWIEIDVRYVNGHLLVIHDDNVNHPKDGIVNIYRKKFEYLRKIDIGKNQTIPTLDEVLLLINNKACLNIELKGSNAAKPVCHLIEKEFNSSNWVNENILLSSFNHEELKIARNQAPDIQLGLLIDEITFDFISVARDLNANFINISDNIATKAMIDEIHNHGMKVLIYTVNDIERMKILKDIGADGVFTNSIDICNKTFMQ